MLNLLVVYNTEKLCNHGKNVRINFYRTKILLAHQYSETFLLIGNFNKIVSNYSLFLSFALISLPEALSTSAILPGQKVHSSAKQDPQYTTRNIVLEARLNIV